MNSKVSALVGAIAVVYFGYQIFGATEAPSGTLSMLYWVFLLLGLFALVGSLFKISQGK